MKRLQTIMLSGLAVLAIGLAACSSSDGGSPAPAPGASSAGASSADAAAGKTYEAAATEILDRLGAAASEVAAVMARADITSDAWQQELVKTLEPFAAIAAEVMALGDPPGFEAVHAKLIDATGAFAQGALSFGLGVAGADLDALGRAGDELAAGATAVTEARILLQTAIAELTGN